VNPHPEEGKREGKSKKEREKCEKRKVKRPFLNFAFASAQIKLCLKRKKNFAFAWFAL